VNVDVLVVGAGPAGLAAAIELRKRGVGRVLVVDREEQAGGIARHSAHTGYGLRDLRRLMTGPAYARHYAEAAAGSGAEIRLGTTVTGWAAVRSATVTSPAGLETIDAAAVLLATGCRERPRPARLIPGDRPAGIMTTGELQQRVYLRGERLPGRALVLGAEHVSFSAMVTLAHAGADVTALVTGQPRQQSYAAFALGASLRWRVPVWTSTAVSRVIGRPRPAGPARSGAELAGPALTGVELTDLRTGMTRVLACDTLVVTGDWIADHELARLAGIEIDPGTRGPAVDTGLETSVKNVFAAGNLVHAAETADVAALGGRHAARHVAAALRAPELAGAGLGEAGAAGAGLGRAGNAGAGLVGAGPAGMRLAGAGNAGIRRVPVTADAPLCWISPNVVPVPLPRSPAAPATAPPRGRFVLRSDIFRRLARLEVRQDGRLLATARASLVPARPVRLDASWLAKVDPAGGPVHIRLA
jgi:thioredoxin reductase